METSADPAVLSTVSIHPGAHPSALRSIGEQGAGSGGDGRHDRNSQKARGRLREGKGLVVGLPVA